jgi:type IV secretory pathway component VirB8
MLINLSEKKGEPEVLSSLLKTASQSPAYTDASKETFVRIREKIESQL